MAPVALLAVACSCALAWVGEPAEHATTWALGMVAWGALVAVALGHANVGAPRPTAARGRELVALAAAAAAVRAPLLAVEPSLSDDLYRFTWEGRLWWAGFSPFAYPPDHPSLVPLRDEVWARVNHPEVSSIYPPLAQLAFATVGTLGTSAWRLFAAACDVGTACVLGRQHRRAGWTWACLSLPAVESAVGGHLEALGCALVALALTTRGRRDTLADATAWLAAMTKLLPAILLARRPPRVLLVFTVLTALAAWPLVGDGLSRGFETYRAHWSFNGSVFSLLATLGMGNDGARRACQAVGLVVAALAVARCGHDTRRGLWVFGAFVVLSPTVHPWYGLWPLLPALLLDVAAWVWLAVLLPLAYVVLASMDPATGAWREAATTRWAIYLPFYVLLAHGALRRWRTPCPHPVH